MTRIRPRLRAPEGPGRTGLRPVASPVSTFAPEGVGEARRLAQLAEGLSRLNPALTGLATTLADRSIDKQSKEGEAEARRLIEEGTTFREAIEDGTIESWQSPWFRLGAKQQFARASAERFVSDFSNAVASQLSESEDMEDFDSLLSEFRAEWAAENLGDIDGDSVFLNAFGQRADSQLEGLRRQHAIQAGQRMARSNFDDLEGTINNGTFNLIQSGADDDTIVASIKTEMDRQLAVGGRVSARRVNESVLTGLVSAAVRSAQDAALPPDTANRILALADVIGTAPGATLAGPGWAQEVLASARDRVTTERVRLDAAAQREEDELVESLQQRFIDEISADPLNVDFVTWISRMNTVSPTAAARLGELRNAIANPILARQVDPTLVDSFLSDIWSAPGSPNGHRQALLAALRDRQIDAGTFQNLMGVVTQAENAFSQSQQSPGSALLRGVYSQVYPNFTRRFGAELTLSGEAADRRAQATLEFNQQWANWLATNPEGSPTEARTFLGDLSDALTRKWRAPLDDIQIGGAMPAPASWSIMPRVEPETFFQLDGVLSGTQALDPALLQQLPSGIAAGDPATTLERLQQFIEAQRRFFSAPDSNRDE